MKRASLRMAEILRRLGQAAGALVALTIPAKADALCQHITHAGAGFTICTVHAAQEPRLRLWLDDQDGRTLAHFDRVKATLAKDETLIFAMNAGMYHPDYRPVGLFVSDGRERAPLVTGGDGNFGMEPNGVFCTGGARPFQVVETRRFAKERPACRLATQSGPMLVIKGRIHPRFLPDSDSRYIRNGVGVTRNGKAAIFAISDAPVTFYDFARLFRDVLKTPDALYFDGSISRLYAPEMNRADYGRALGPIIGLVAATQP